MKEREMNGNKAVFLPYICCYKGPTHDMNIKGLLSMW